MRQRLNLLTLLFIFALTAFSFYVVWPGNPDQYLPDFIPWPKGRGLQLGDFDRRAMRLGLDLRGGTRILLEADTSDLPPGADLDQTLDGALRVIERRVNAFGVAESEIQRESGNRISVQLPGIDPDEARRLIGRTALLEFKEMRRDAEGNILCQGLDGSIFATRPEFITADPSTGQQFCFEPPPTPPQGQEQQQPPSEVRVGTIIWDPALGQDSDGNTMALTGRHLKANAQVLFTSLSQPQVRIEFDSVGARLFGQITTRLVGQPLGIFLDEELISAPIVQQPLTDGNAVITGPPVDEARDLAKLLNIGALPVTMRPIQQQEVDATLGADSVRKSVQAGEIGILAVMAFMILYYRFPGLLASTALIVYGSTLLMIFKLWPVTLTLAGIAAFVLSVGMAVDANILIFERMREELRAGRSLRAAIDLGFDRAWTSIRDSNVSTLITCVILYWFGDQFGASLVKGFALTLGIGVLVSMFSAIFVTRTFLRAVLRFPWARRMWLYAVPETRPASVPTYAEGVDVDV